MAFPTFTKTWHTSPYAAISATRPELSTAGKSIFITGGGSGIGPGIAHAFATSGAKKITSKLKNENTKAGHPSHQHLITSTLVNSPANQNTHQSSAAQLLP